MDDRFKLHAATIQDPAGVWEAITPDDDADLPRVYQALWCQVPGIAVLVDRAGTELPFDLDIGPSPLRPVRVKATGTTAELYGLLP